MNYYIVTAANRSNVYLRSGELQEVSKTILYVTAYSVCYIALTAYILMMWAVDVLLTPHFDNSWSPQEWELSPVHTVCSQPIVDAVPYVQSEEAKARQIKYAMPVAEPVITAEPVAAKRLTECLEATIATAKNARKSESYRLTTTPRHQRFAYEQIVSIGLELCDLPEKRTY